MNLADIFVRGGGTGGGKQGRLVRILIKQTVVTVGLVISQVGGWLMMDEWAASSVIERDQEKSSLSALQAKVTKLQNDLVKAEKSLPIYEMLMHKYENGVVTLDRQEARTTLDTLKDRYALTTLHVTLNGLQEIPASGFKNKYLTAVASGMVLSMESLTDEQVVAFLNDLQQALPGRLRYTDMTITRGMPFGNQLLASLTQNGRADLIKTEVKLQWMGTKASPEAKPPEPPKPPVEAP
jgi:hypothetical protein